MGALVEAWSVGKSSGEDEGAFGRVVTGGALVKRTDLGACVTGGGGVGGVVRFDLEKCQKKASWTSSKPSVGLKFCSVQKRLYVFVKLLKAVQPSRVMMLGFLPVSRSNVKVVAISHPSSSKCTLARRQALRIVSSILDDS